MTDFSDIQVHTENQRLSNARITLLRTRLTSVVMLPCILYKNDECNKIINATQKWNATYFIIVLQNSIRHKIC